MEKLAKLRGSAQYKKFLKGERLTRGEAILAQCYVCNGQHVGDNKDCQAAATCPLYQYFPYKGK